MLDGWMVFSADERVAELIFGLRQRLDALLAAKVNTARALDDKPRAGICLLLPHALLPSMSSSGCVTRLFLVHCHGKACWHVLMVHIYIYVADRVARPCHHEDWWRNCRRCGAVARQLLHRSSAVVRGDGKNDVIQGRQR